MSLEAVGQGADGAGGARDLLEHLVQIGALRGGRAKLVDVASASESAVPALANTWRTSPMRGPTSFNGNCSTLRAAAVSGGLQVLAVVGQGRDLARAPAGSSLTRGAFGKKSSATNSVQ